MARYRPEIEFEEPDPYRKPTPKEVKALRESLAKGSVAESEQSSKGNQLPSKETPEISSLKELLETYRVDLRKLAYGNATQDEIGLAHLRIDGAKQVMRSLGIQDEEIASMIKSIEIKFPVKKHG